MNVCNLDNGIGTIRVGYAHLAPTCMTIDVVEFITVHVALSASDQWCAYCTVGSVVFADA